MTLHQFTIFAAIAKHRSITKASQEVHVTQPGVSQQMRLLQAEYGSKFYDRTPTGVELTEAGHRLRMAITPILEQVRTLKRACNLKNSQSESERFAIGATHSLSSNLIPSLLSHFKKAHPQTMIDFRISDATGIERLLLKGNVFSVSESAARALVCKKRAARLNAFEFASSHRAGSLRVVA